MTAFLDHAAAIVDDELDRRLPGAEVLPTRLHQAMRYAVFGSAKRLRPGLVLAAGRAVMGPTAETRCRPAMAAVEILHTYTLVHDDLPAMDDDDLRRGRPTVHKAFDEATAILVGDALLTLALEIAALAGADQAVCLARAGGSLGVVGGQQEDLEAEGLPIVSDDPTRSRLERIHRGKTAALIRASCELGALACHAEPALRQRLCDYGEAIGLAFQIQDDLLDATADTVALGKTAGKDAQAGKLTYVSVYGLDAARAEAARLVARAEDLLSPLGTQAEDLLALGRFAISRKR